MGYWKDTTYEIAIIAWNNYEESREIYFAKLANGDWRREYASNKENICSCCGRDITYGDCTCAGEYEITDTKTILELIKNVRHMPAYTIQFNKVHQPHGEEYSIVYGMEMGERVIEYYWSDGTIANKKDFAWEGVR